MSIPNRAKGTIRTLKNITGNYSDIQIKVREATSNDAVGPNGAILAEIARASFSHHAFMEVMEIVDKRLDDSGKNWRHVFKALNLMEYLLSNGSEEVVLHCKDSLYVIKTLREFQYIDEKSRDQGANIRHKAKQLTELLTDEAQLKELRKGIRNQMESSYGNTSSYGNSGYGDTNYGNSSYGNGGGFGSTGYANGGNDRMGTSNYGRNQYSGNNNDQEDRELQLAIEESKRMSQPTQQPKLDPDRDLQLALELSKKEAEQEASLREQNIAKENELVLLEGYDPTPKPNNPMTSHIKQYDFFGNLVHDPTPKTSGTHDLLGLDPLSFSSTQSNYNNNNFNTTSFNTTSYIPPLSSNNNNNSQVNPFTQDNNQNLFQNQQQQQQLQLQQQQQNKFDGLSSKFNNQFDGGFNAKLMPHQTEKNANAALAEIARNSHKIDPFASFAAERDSNSSPKPNLFNNLSPNNKNLNLTQQSNPFHGTWSNANTPLFNNSSPINQQTPANLFSTNLDQNKPPASLDLFNNNNSNSNTNPFGQFNQQSTTTSNNSNLFGQQQPPNSNNSNLFGQTQNLFQNSTQQQQQDNLFQNNNNNNNNQQQQGNNQNLFF